MFRFKLTNQFVERYHGVVSCALKIGDLISNNFYKVIKTFLKYFSVRFISQLIDFWVTVRT
jgi:hypothetical protein